MSHHVVLQIDSEVYENREAPEDIIPCSLCAFDRNRCFAGFCLDTLGERGYFKKVAFDDILAANLDVLHRLKMGIVPTTPPDDDSEFIND